MFDCLPSLGWDQGIPGSVGSRTSSYIIILLLILKNCLPLPCLVINCHCWQKLLKTEAAHAFPQSIPPHFFLALDIDMPRTEMLATLLAQVEAAP